jgi:hypothetical protein
MNMPALIPHSPAWFAALEKTNPQQAAQTRQILALAKREDVCSICGDEPARDYEKKEMPEQPTTLRLCADCLTIRKSMHGEEFSSIGG